MGFIRGNNGGIGEISYTDKVILNNHIFLIDMSFFTKLFGGDEKKDKAPPPPKPKSEEEQIAEKKIKI